jgi:hypothetical protein
VNIVVGSDFGNAVPGDTYTTSDILGNSTSTFLDLFDTQAGTGLQLYFLSPLTNAGDTSPLGIHLLVGANTVAYEAGNGSYNDSITAAPEPQTTLLMLFGIIAVAFAPRRYSSTPLRQFCRLKR